MINPTFAIPLMGKQIVVRGVDSFDVALWEDALRIDRARLDWVRIHGATAHRGDSCDVRLEVAPERYRAFRQVAGSASAAGDAIVDEITREATRIVEHDALRDEVEERIPIGLLDDKEWVRVEWSLSEACTAALSVETLSPAAEPVMLARLEDVATRERIIVDVCLPEVMRQAVIAMPKDKPLSDRVYDTIMAEAERHGRGATIGEDAIPF